MPLNKVNPGNMYQHVTHTHNHLAGACPHACTYCSTQDMARRFPALAKRYSGPPRLVEKELFVNYGTGKTIFVENCSDLFAEGIDAHWIGAILSHCRHSPDNTYVFQTKNPGRVSEFLFLFPPRFLIGTTAETNWIDTGITSMPPPPRQRLKGLMEINCFNSLKFITIEPIMKFDLDYFVHLLHWTHVPTIYIGADSKNHHLPEPTGEEIGELVKWLRVYSGKEVILKSNLKRLYKGK